MTDTPEDKDTDLGPLTIEYPTPPQTIAFGGSASLWMISHPEETTHFDQIKGCIGQVTITLPNGNDETKFIVRVQDTFELRSKVQSTPSQLTKIRARPSYPLQCLNTGQRHTKLTTKGRTVQ